MKTLVVRNRQFVVLCAGIGLITGLLGFQIYVGVPTPPNDDALQQYVNGNLTRSINETNAQVAWNKDYMEQAYRYAKYTKERTDCLEAYVGHLAKMIKTNRIQVANTTKRSKFYPSDSTWYDDDDTWEQRLPKCMEQAANRYTWGK